MFVCMKTAALFDSPPQWGWEFTNRDLRTGKCTCRPKELRNRLGSIIGSNVEKRQQRESDTAKKSGVPSKNETEWIRSIHRKQTSVIFIQETA